MYRELTENLRPYIGLNISEIAALQGSLFKSHKGHAGQIIETLLGADGSNAKGPDLPDLGVEIKTLPINLDVKVMENTFVCCISLPFTETQFESSDFYLKAKRILFVPIIVKKKGSLSDKVLAEPFLWELNGKDLSIIKQDWIELSSYLRLGSWSSINSTLGEILHIRPKAANSRELSMFQALGGHHRILPIGFYLRKSFTQSLVEINYAY